MSTAPQADVRDAGTDHLPLPADRWDGRQELRADLRPAVLLALALGADAAFVGRPMFHALAAAGADGAGRALAELGAELVESMRLSGCPDITDLRGIACADRGFGA